MRFLQTKIALPLSFSVSLSLILSLSILSSSAQAAVTAITTQQCNDMQTKGVIDSSAPIPCKRLKTVTFQHINFDGNKQQGQLVVLDAVAPHVDKIMQQLFEMQFPIHQATPIQAFKGDDELSMNANNTSAFNYRKIAGKKSVSLHAYGVAIDINPLQNPFVSFTNWGTATFKPLLGHQYLNRKQYRLGKPAAQGFAEQVVDVFAQHGFRTWGGDWNTPIDFQHFQTSREMANLMALLRANDAALFFNHYVTWYQQCLSFSQTSQQTLTIKDYSAQLTTDLQSIGLSNMRLDKAYQQSPEPFLTLMKKPKKANLQNCFN